MPGSWPTSSDNVDTSRSTSTVPVNKTNPHQSPTITIIIHSMGTHNSIHCHCTVYGKQSLATQIL